MFKISVFGLSSVFYTSCTKKEPYPFIGKTHKFKNLLNLMTLALIRQAFLEKIPHTTRIIISQRVSSIQDADQILVIDDGKISGLGTHEELLKSNAMYKETFEAQNNGGDFDEQ